MTIPATAGMPTEVLLVEDSPGDVRLTQEAFRDANQSVHLHIALQTASKPCSFSEEGKAPTSMPLARTSSCWI